MQVPEHPSQTRIARCPDNDQLAQFSLGILPHDRMLAVERHVSQCPTCLERLNAGSHLQDEFVRLLRRPDDEEPFDRQAEEHIVDLVHRRVTRLRRAPVSEGIGDSAFGSVIGSYRLIDVVGHGSYGVVYRAEHVTSHQTVAIKILSSFTGGDPQTVTRFQRELAVLGDRQHTNVVTATEGGNYRGTPFLVMPWVDGISLSDIARHIGPLRVSDACAIGCQLAAGLQHAHECGVVHRDIKTSNVMLSRDGRAQILDFGLALLQLEDSSVQRLTSSGHILGTADYMAPEQINDSRRVDGRADLYSLGCVLYVLLAGHPPFSGRKYRSAMAKLRAHCAEPAPPLEPASSEVPQELAAVVLHLLSKAPEDRPPAAADVIDRLRPWSAGSDLEALVRRCLEL